MHTVRVKYVLYLCCVVLTCCIFIILISRQSLTVQSLIFGQNAMYALCETPNKTGLNTYLQSSIVPKNLSSNIHRERKIYTCHNNWVQKLSKQIFRTQHVKILQKNDITFSNDILVNAYDQYNRDKNCQNYNFVGKRVVFDGEAYDFHNDMSNLYYVGRPIKDMNFKGQVSCIYAAMFMLYPMNISPLQLLKPRIKQSRKFLIYAQSHCVRFRESAFDMIVSMANSRGLSNPHAFGNCYGSHPELHIRNKPKKTWKQNYKSMQDYRFVLAMENTARAGYITEKIINAFLASTIPIYHGTIDIMKIFNSDSFIFFNISNPEPALQKILYLEKNATAYDEMLKTPVLKNGLATLKQYFFSYPPSQQSSNLEEKIFNMLKSRDVSKI